MNKSVKEMSIKKQRVRRFLQGQSITLQSQFSSQLQSGGYWKRNNAPGSWEVRVNMLEDWKDQENKSTP